MYIQQIAAIGVFGLSGGWLIAKAAEWCHKTKMEKSMVMKNHSWVSRTIF